MSAVRGFPVLLALAVAAPWPASGAEQAGPAAAAEQPIVIPASLDELVAEVVKTNPNVELAEARLREAEAELRVARVAAAADAVELFQARKLLEQTLAVARDRMGQVDAMARAGTAPQEELLESRLAVLEKEIALAGNEAALRLLIGRGPDVAATTRQVDEGGAGFLVVPDPRPEMPAEFRGILDREMDGIAFEDVSLEEAVRIRIDRAGVDLHVQFEVGLEDVRVNGLFPPMRLGDYLLALADRYGICFILRDYGFFATTLGSGGRLRGPAIPADLPYASARGVRPPRPSR